MTLSPNETAVLAAAVALLLILASAAAFAVGRSRRSRNLLEQNEYLAAIIDSANEGIYVTDRERRFLVWNAAAERIAGYGSDQVIGKNCHENILCHVDGDGRELCFTRCPLQAAVEQGLPGGPEIIYLRHRDGRRVPVSVKTAPVRDGRGEIIGGVEIFEDVTERLEKERLLRERKEKLEAVLDGIGDGILFLDSRGIVRGVNRAGLSLMDLQNTLAGARLVDLDAEGPLRKMLSLAERTWKPADEDRAASPDCAGRGTGIRCWIARSDAGPTDVLSPCWTCAAYRRSRSYLERSRELTWGPRTLSVVSAFLEPATTGEFWEIILFRDVSAEKLDAALNVAGAAAHELRQPLQVLVMVAGMLKRSDSIRTELGPHLDAMSESCGRMDRIIQAMTELTAYRTKAYVDGTTILDIKGSSDRGHD